MLVIFTRIANVEILKVTKYLKKQLSIIIIIKSYHTLCNLNYLNKKKKKTRAKKKINQPC